MIAHAVRGADHVARKISKTITNGAVHTSSDVDGMMNKEEVGGRTQDNHRITFNLLADLSVYKLEEPVLLI